MYKKSQQFYKKTTLYIYMLETNTSSTLIAKTQQRNVLYFNSPQFNYQPPSPLNTITNRM